MAPVARGFNDGLNFRNIMTKNEEGGGDGVKTVRNRECCHCGGDQLKRNFPQLVGEKNKDGKSGKDASGQWCIRQSG